jgi:hypothetical protein
MQVEEMCACDIESSLLHWIPKYSKYRSVFNKRYYEVLFEDQEITVLHCYASLSQNKLNISLAANVSRAFLSKLRNDKT